MEITITLTEDEVEVIDSYIFRKACRLEESGLTDSKCYPRLMSVHRKIVKAQNEKNNKKLFTEQ